METAKEVNLCGQPVIKASRKKMDALKLLMMSDIESIKERIKAFAERVIKEPWYALEWAEDAYLSAATLLVKKSVMVWLTEESPASDKARWDYVMAHAKGQVMLAARYPARSTSPWSNEMKREIGSAWARFVGRYENVVID